MQITYGGIPIATEPPDGTDGILGFMMPTSRQNVQWAEFLRAPDAAPIARGNRRRTLTGTIWPASATTYAAALLLRNQWYESLPSRGAIFIQEGASRVAFQVAVLESIAIAENTEGVSYGLIFTFAVGPPSYPPAPGPLLDSTGSPILDSTGSPITTT